MGNIDVNFKLDTGEDTNIISQQMYNQLQPLPAVGKSPVTLRAFDGQRIESIGVFKVPLKYRNKVLETVFKIVPDGNNALLGSYDCEHIGLIKRVDMKDETSNVNDSTGS